MNEILTYVYELIIQDTYLKSIFGTRVYSYEPSETDITSEPFIIIDPLIPFDTNIRASNTFHSKAFYFQLNIETYNGEIAHDAFSYIIDLLEKHKLINQNDGMDTYFRETRRFVITERFYGTPILLNKE